jgi:hypothetical protein
MLPAQKRQHYVPKFYLKSFGNPTIYCYDKLKNKSIKTTIDNIAVGKAFYDLDGIEGALESSLAQIETYSSQAYYELLEKKDVGKLSKASKVNLFLFLGAQFLRTEENRLALKDMSSQSLGKLAKISGIKIPDQFKVTYDDKTVKRMSIHMLIENAPKIACMFYQKKWVVQENDNSIPLWTSDHPIALHNTIDKGPFYGSLGIMCKGIEIRFPLTSKLNLISFDPTTHRIKGDASKLEEGNVIYDNMIQLRKCSRFVYASSDKDFERARMFIKDYPMFKSPNRKRMQVY